MELVQADGGQTESFQAGLASRAQMARVAVDGPIAVRPLEPALGRYEHVLRSAKRTQRLRDEAFIVTDVTVVEAVDVGRVDERHPRFEGGVNHPDAFTLGAAARNGEGHGAKPYGGHRYPSAG